MSAAVSPPAAVCPQPHTWLDDAQGFLLGSVFVSLGVAMFGANGQLIGGTAGIAFLLHYLSGQSIGLMFFLANLPFFWLALTRMGWRFGIKSLIAVGLLSGLMHVMPQLVAFGAIAPLYSALAGGLLIGMGALAFVRHGASIGGLNILAVYLQNSRGISAGKVMIGADALILIASLFVVDAVQLLYSLLGAVLLGAVLAFNHKPGRYTGV